MHLRTTADDLARWLERQGGNWTVDGEPSLVRTLPSPTSAVSLAAVLRQRQGELLVFAPETCALPEHAYVGHAELPATAHLVEGHHVFQLAWVSPEGARDSWLLAEHDKMAPSGDGEATATRIVAGFKQAWPSPNIGRKPG
jgi:hypothetical protein